MIKSLKRRISLLDEHTLEVLQKSGASTIVKVAGVIVGLLVNMVLGHLLGASGLGIINLCNQIVNIVLIFCLLGVSQILIKEIAIGFSKENYQHINDVMHSAYLLNGGVTVITSVILILLAPWIADHVFHNTKLTIPLVISSIVLTPQIFSRIFSAALVGYKKIWQSNLVDQTLSVAITGILLLVAYLSKIAITVNAVAVLYAIGRLSVTITFAVYLQKLRPKKGTKGKIVIRYLLKSSLPLLLVSAALIISGSIDSIMLGWLKNSREVGLYNVAFKIATLTSFFLYVTIYSVAPKIAVLYNESKLKELEKMVQSVVFILAMIGIVSLIGFLVLGHFILSLWGSEFKVAYSPLIILSIGQLFNIVTGAVGNILVMTNYEKILRNITISVLFVNVTLNFFLIEHYGILGASVSTLITMMLNMMFSTYYVKRKVGFWPVGFSKIRKT